MSKQQEQRGEHTSMKMTMRLGPRSYDIILKRGSLGRLGQLADLMNRRVLVVTDDGVPAQWPDAVLAQCTRGYKLVLPAGEATKCFSQLEKICRTLLENGFTRADAVVAVGGGVVGDLAGFAAAVYMRGIAFINCPTTTLSQVDSSIGGKTAIDLAGAKNAVGAFHQPELVVIDPDTLSTLPPRHFANGLAEAVKAGLLGDEKLFALFEEGDAAGHIEEILARVLAVKKAVVEQDERDTGARACLNFGHTLGHAVESASDMGLLHGECVGLGMLPMITDKTLRRRAAAVLKGLGLPVKVRYDGAAVQGFLAHDKKLGSGDKLTVVRVAEAGSYYLEQLPLEAVQAMVGSGIG